MADGQVSDKPQGGNTASATDGVRVGEALGDGGEGRFHARETARPQRVKWDGYRALLLKEGKRVQIRSRNERDLTSMYPAIAAVAARLSSSKRSSI